MRLPKRLSAIAELVPPGSRVCDVGTDHGYVPAWLVLSGACPSAIAADVSAKCLARARETAERCGAAERIDFRLSDGLANIALDEWDTLIVAGMGGETIAQILEPLTLEPTRSTALERKTLILQPNTKQLELLQFLRTHGFAIAHELLVRDRKRDYYVVNAEC